jgi:hypothetical protein
MVDSAALGLVPRQGRWQMLVLPVLLAPPPLLLLLLLPLLPLLLLLLLLLLPDDDNKPEKDRKSKESRARQSEATLPSLPLCLCNARNRPTNAGWPS